MVPSDHRYCTRSVYDPMNNEVDLQVAMEGSQRMLASQWFVKRAFCPLVLYPCYNMI